jgi:hypothetical protein
MTERNEINRIVVCGLGGVGFWLTLALAKMIDPKRITAFDGDTLAGGLGHTRLPSGSMTTSKVDLLRGHLLVSYGCEPPNLVFGRFTGEECDENTLVVDASDMQIDIRREIWDKARARGARCLRVSYDGKNGTVTVVEGLPLQGSKAGGYREVPTLGLSFMAGGMGAEVVRQILAGLNDHVEFQVSLLDLGGWVKPKPVPAVETSLEAALESANGTVAINPRRRRAVQTQEAV